MSTAKKLFWSCFAAGLAIGLLLIFWHPQKKAEPVKPVQNKQACVDEPCIEITQADGKKFKLNDFRFQPNHCIQFKEFKSEVLHYTCGAYQLQWIGPDNSEQKTNTPIET
jgi:hypothetical protein